MSVGKGTVPNEYLLALEEARRVITDAQMLHESFLHLSYNVQKNVHWCIEAELPGHEPYSRNLLNALQECERSEKYLQNLVQCAAQYEEYLSNLLTPIIPTPDLSKVFEL